MRIVINEPTSKDEKYITKQRKQGRFVSIFPPEKFTSEHLEEVATNYLVYSGHADLSNHLDVMVTTNISEKLRQIKAKHTVVSKVISWIGSILNKSSQSSTGQCSGICIVQPEKIIVLLEYMDIAVNYKRNNIWIETLVHELIHACDIWDIYKLENLKSLDQVQTDPKYRSYHAWTEYHAYKDSTLYVNEHYGPVKPQIMGDGNAYHSYIAYNLMCVQGLCSSQEKKLLSYAHIQTYNTFRLFAYIKYLDMANSIEPIDACIIKYIESGDSLNLEASNKAADDTKNNNRTWNKDATPHHIISKALRPPKLTGKLGKDRLDTFQDMYSLVNNINTVGSLLANKDTLNTSLNKLRVSYDRQFIYFFPLVFVESSVNILTNAFNTIKQLIIHSYWNVKLSRAIRNTQSTMRTIQ